MENQARRVFFCFCFCRNHRFGGLAEDLLNRELEEEKEKSTRKKTESKNHGKIEDTNRINEKSELRNYVLDIRARRRSERKMRKSPNDFEEHVELLSKHHKDQMEIRREKLKLCKKELNIRQK